MTNTTGSFEDLASAFKRQFGDKLEIDENLSVSDGTIGGVASVGSVRSNWLKRNAPKHGFVRVGDSATLRELQATPNLQASPAIEAERSEVEAVTTVTSMLHEAVSASTAEEPDDVYHGTTFDAGETWQGDDVDPDEEDS